MKKHLLAIFSLSALLHGQSSACGWDGYSDDYTSNQIFNQEVTEEQDYFQFLRTFEFSYDKAEIKTNQNCRDWANYFGITPEQAYYLVNDASKVSLEQLQQSGKALDKKLAFADKNFCKSKKEGLNYLSYAKYLEPFMKAEKESWYGVWSYRYHQKPLDELKYEETIENLISAYESQTNKDLKIRYGYQIVRLAHYKRQYKEAVEYFYKYVESLNYKPEIYYYALSQKAGAADACDYKKENPVSDFLTVFSESKDLKFSAYKSLRFCNGRNGLSKAFSMANNSKDKRACDIYFLLAYNNFNNPINELEKIVKIDINAPQAKILMARYIAEIESELFSPYRDSYGKESARKKFSNVDDAIRIAESQAQTCSNKNFWNLACSFLHTYCLEYDKAKNSLSKVTASSDLYKEQKDMIGTIIDICEPMIFTDNNANNAFEKHENSFGSYIIRKIMASRYQEINNKAKHFLSIYSIETDDPDRGLWEEIIALAQKSNKSKLEKWLLGNDGKVDMEYLNNRLGMANFYEGNIPAAKKLVTEKLDFNAKNVLCYTIGHIIYNKTEDSNTFYNDYISETIGNVSFENTNIKEVLSTLNKLYDLSEGDNTQAAKASFLLGNFYYNLSHEGYYRNSFNYDENFGTVASFYYTKAQLIANEDELMACILFAMQKASDRNNTLYFEKLNELKHTNFHKEAVSKCSHFADFVSSNEQGQ